MRDRLRRVFTPRRVLEAALILAVIFGAQYWQTRGLAEGAAPPLAGVLTDGSQAIDWGVRGVPTHFIVDGAGNIRFRVVGYATTWGLKARLWWAETFSA